jgi:hypothetical protein
MIERPGIGKPADSCCCLFSCLISLDFDLHRKHVHGVQPTLVRLIVACKDVFPFRYFFLDRDL